MRVREHLVRPQVHTGKERTGTYHLPWPPRYSGRKRGEARSVVSTGELSLYDSGYVSGLQQGGKRQGERGHEVEKDLENAQSMSVDTCPLRTCTYPSQHSIDFKEE